MKSDCQPCLINYRNRDLLSKIELYSDFNIRNYFTAEIPEYFKLQFRNNLQLITLAKPTININDECLKIIPRLDITATEINKIFFNSFDFVNNGLTFQSDIEIATWCIINNKIVLPKLVDKVNVWNSIY